MKELSSTDAQTKFWHWRRSRIVLGLLLGLSAYSIALRPLRNIFDDRWPYINTFLVAPGRAATTACIAIGLAICITNRHTSPAAYRRLIAGFVLLLVSPLLTNLYAAWIFGNRTELDSLIFNVPWRMFIWKWFFYFDVPHLISAVGMGLIVWGIAKLNENQMVVP